MEMKIMNKDEILEMSRKENNNQDVYEKEVIKEGGNAGSIAAAILATVFFIMQIFLDGGMNYGLYAVVFSIPAASFTVKALRLKKKHEVVMAVIYILMTLLASTAHIMNLFEAYGALK